MPADASLLSPELRDAALRAVLAAAEVTRALQGRSGAACKADDSPVTVADFAAQALICRELRRVDSSPIVAEETSAMLRDPVHAHLLASVTYALTAAWPGVTPGAILDAIDAGTHDVPTKGSFWTLDPIDGTKGFVRAGQYAVCLARLEEGRVIAGFMACPNLHPGAPDPTVSHGTGCVLATGARGVEVAEWRPGSAAPPSFAPLPARTRSANHSDLVIAVSPAKSANALARLRAGAARAGFTLRHVLLDGQAKYAVVINGDADAYVRLASRSGYAERIWDHAPGSCLARQAGLAVTDAAGRPLDFGAGISLSRNGGIICAAPGLHARLVEALRERQT